MRIVPVVAIQNAEDSMQLADALIEGGLPCAEITFRTTAAIDAMRIMAKRNDILVGAGTVIFYRSGYGEQNGHAERCPDVLRRRMGDHPHPAGHQASSVWEVETLQAHPAR